MGRGGRYDEVGQVFGRPRPATGFSLDLRELASATDDVKRRRILAPRARSPELVRLVAQLRSRGEIVVDELSGQADARGELGCDHVLAHVDGRWQVRPLDNAPARAQRPRRRRNASSNT